MAPLTGGAVAGLCCELTFAIGTRPHTLLIPLLIACAAYAVVYKRKWEWRHLGEVYLLYVVALLPAVISPFPIVGIWNGDWFYLFKAGQTLWEGGRLSFESLQRPPLFGAGAAPLWVFADGLIPYQIFSAVMSAGTLGSCLFAADRFWPTLSRFRLLAPLVCSVFFLHHTAACWAKLAAAGFVLAAAVDFSREHSPVTAWSSGVWFALAVAMHQSSLIYLPVLIVIWTAQPDRSFLQALKILAIFAACGLLLVGLFEGWTIWEYGWRAKIVANPSFSQREPNVSFAANTILVIVTSFLGWAPIDHVIQWWHASNPWSRAQTTKEGFWIATSWLEILAATFLGAYLPFLLSGSRNLARRLWTIMHTSRGLIYTMAVLLIVILNGMLNPFFSANGTMQTGLVALGLGGFLLLGAWLEEEQPQRWSCLMGITAGIGTLPWLLLNLGVSTGLRCSGSFRDNFVAGSEGDWKLLLANHLTPLGLSSFPTLPIMLLAFGAAWFFWQAKFGQLRAGGLFR